MPFDMTEQENVLSRRILVTEMVHGDLAQAKKNALLNSHGYDTPASAE